MKDLLHTSLHAALWLIVAGFTLMGCGYTVAGSKPTFLGSISIGYINNATLEPGLEDGLQKALAAEFMKHGVRFLSGGGAHQLSGTITKFSMTGLADKDGFFTDYEVIIIGAFHIRDAEGVVRELKASGPFLVAFPIEADLAGITAVKEEAVNRALEDLAIEIAASVLYSR